MKWVKLLIGLLLTPALVAAIWALGDLTSAGWRVEEWHAPWFWGLLSGFTIWTIAYITFPRPMWIYVFGHELTHALAVYLQGGKVLGFRVASRGGHVKTDTINWWITLSPYFVPLYCLIWIALWMTINFYHPIQGYQWLLYGVVGITWGFHLTFTVSMIKLGQTDLSSQGYLFSIVIILLINLLLIELFLTGVMEHHTILRWIFDLWGHLRFTYCTTAFWIGGMIKWCWLQTVALCHK